MTNPFKTITHIDGSIPNIPSPSYTVSGTGGYTLGNISWSPWTTTTTADNYSITAPSTLKPSGKLSLQGADADIEINGESVVAMLRQIQQRMNILTVNAELEAEWEELRELGKQYRALEKHIIEKMQTWNRLRAQDNENR